MLNNGFFYFSLFKKYQKLFGSLFNDIVINRTDANGNISQVINVPIQYAQKEKMLTRVMGDPSINRPDEVILPTMSYFMSGYDYDAERMSSQIRSYVITQQNSNITYTYTAAPWNFDFELYVYVKNTEDANKILEQALPFFTPSWTIPALLLPGLQSLDLPVELISVSHEDMDTESYKDNPFLVWTLRFTLKGYLWGPIRQGKTISTIDVQYYLGEPPVSNTIANIESFGISSNIFPASMNGAPLAFIQEYQPGLTANGQPTSNQAQTIPVNSINFNDNFGLIETTTDVIDIVSNTNHTVQINDMTGNGTAFSFDANSSFLPGGAFKGGSNTGWVSNGAIPDWLMYDFGFNKFVIINKYTLERSLGMSGGWSNNIYSPMNWQFQGSRDDLNWNILDTQTNQLVAAGANASNYSINNLTPYRYYRIYVTEGIVSNTISISQMTMGGVITS